MGDINEDFSKKLDNIKPYCFLVRMFYFLIREIPMFPRRIKWFLQTLFRGYSDCDLWGLDFHLAKLILKRLKAFSKMSKVGVPSNVSVDGDNNELTKASAKWEEIINKMIYAFEYVVSDYGLEYDDYLDEKKLEERHNKYKEGMKFFCEYFPNLWD